MEKASGLILKGKMKLLQLAGIDLTEIREPFNNDEIDKFGAESKPWKRACSNFLRAISNNYPRSKRIQLEKIKKNTA